MSRALGLRSLPLVVALTLVAQPFARAQEPRIEERLRPVLERFRAERHVPGLSAAVGRNGSLVFAEGFGIADLEGEVPARAETSYRLASVSKAVTGILAMRLVERGALDLEADVRRYVTSFPERPEGTILVRHLLCHQGGIRHYRGTEMLRNAPSPSLESALAIFAGEKLVSAPGTAFHYTTYGYTLLGCALESAGGASFAALLQNELARPLSLSTLRVDSNADLIRFRAQGYVRDADGAYRNSAPVDTSYKIPGGGLVASAPDAVRLLLAVQKGEVLGKAALEQLWTPQSLAGGERTSYALGWRIESRGESAREVSHGGAQQRVTTFLYGVPSEGFAAAIFCNLEGVNGLLELARELRRIAG